MYTFVTSYWGSRLITTSGIELHGAVDLYEERLSTWMDLIELDVISILSKFPCWRLDHSSSQIRPDQTGWGGIRMTVRLAVCSGVCIKDESHFREDNVYLIAYHIL